MAPKKSPPPPPAPKTLAAVLGAFTKTAIDAVTDKELHTTLIETLDLVTGVARDVLTPKDAKAKARVAALAEVHIGLDDAIGLAKDGALILDEIRQRDAKQLEASALVAEVNLGIAEIHDHVASIKMIARGKLGAKSPELKAIGIKPLATGRRAASKASKKSAKATAPATK
ncbi:MAG: hypothetical protein ACHREM_14765 [Polyangiales bacterium]